MFAAGRFGPRFGQELAGLDVGPVDKAVVEEDVEALDVPGRTDVEGAGVVAGSQELSVGGRARGFEDAQMSLERF